MIHKSQVFKTINFKNPTYVGDPLNAVRIFNEKKVDELFVMDIDATPQNSEPNFELIAKLSRECEMPLTYAGGIKSLQSAEKIIESGVEKIGVGNEAIKNSELIPKIVDNLGAQSVAGIVNFQSVKGNTKYEIYSPINELSNLDAIQHVQNLLKQGVGELVINSVDRDGTMQGYDTNFLKSVVDISNCALSIIGGAGSIEDFVEALKIADTRVGLAAGSLFTFRGKYRSVLLSYLSEEDRLKFPSVT